MTARPPYPDHKLQEALARHQAGRLDEAAEIYEKILGADPDHPPALHFLGLVRFAQGDAQEAERLVLAAVALDEGQALYWANLGRIRQAAGEPSGASEAYGRALRLTPDDGTLYSDLAASLLADGKSRQAVFAAERAVSLAPDLAQAHLNLGLALLDRARSQGEVGKRARAALDRSLSLSPEQAVAHQALGDLALADGDTEAATRAYQTALDMDSTLLEATCNLANLYREAARFTEAEALYRQGIAHHPGSAALHANLGVTLHETGRFGEALKAYDDALALTSDDPEVHRNRAMTLLTLGRFEEGWRAYEWRWKTARFARERAYQGPLWDGAPNPKLTLLIHAEQGLGDTLQFVRLLPWARARVGRVVLACQSPLVRLLAGQEGADAVLPDGGDLPPFGARFPLLSLAALSGHDPKGAPSKPYLQASDVDLPEAQGPLRNLSRPLIGLCWKGSPHHPRDALRSPGLEALAPLVDGVPATFVSLQKDGDSDLDRLGLTGRVADLMGQCPDFAATAAVIQHLDHVVACDTAVAHLAAGMGKPVSLLLAHVAEWRWGAAGDRSPWYPSVSLYRQKGPQDWASVIEAVREDLAKHHAVG